MARDGRPQTMRNNDKCELDCSEISLFPAAPAPAPPSPRPRPAPGTETLAAEVT